MPSIPMRFEDPDDARPTIERLVGRFESWWSARQPTASESGGSEYELLLDWKVSYGDGCLDVWSVRDVEEFLLEWCPRKVSAGSDWVPPLIECITDAFVFMAESGLLASESAPADALADAAHEMAGECARRMEDPAYFGMAKSLFAGMGVDVEEGLTQERLDAVMQQFNSLPYEQRKAITDPGMGAPEPVGPTIGPVVMPSEERVRESAAAAPVLAGFLALSDFFGTGRPLTKKGNVKLADAGALSEILGTEPLEQTYGDVTLRRHSAQRMPNLDHWVWWAREVGVLRVVKSRMVAVKAWRQRCLRDPQGEASKAFTTLIEYGPLSSYRPWLGGYDLLDDAVVALLSTVMTEGGPVEFEHIVDRVMDLRERVGVRSPLLGTEHERRSVARDVDLMLRLAERAGVVAQHDVVHEPGDIVEVRVGGTVELTDFGISAVVEQARAEGVIVETIEAPEQLGARDLAELANAQDLAVGAWWDLVDTWLQAQDEERTALLDVFTAVDPLLLLALLDDVPEQRAEDVNAVLSQAIDTWGPDHPVSLIAHAWLLETGATSRDDVNPEAQQRYRLGLLGVIAESDPEALPETWGTGSPADLLADVEAVSRLMPLNAVALLDAIGRLHPDKVVAKSARREALRVRSRLANKSR